MACLESKSSPQGFWGRPMGARFMPSRVSIPINIAPQEPFRTHTNSQSSLPLSAFFLLVSEQSLCVCRFPVLLEYRSSCIKSWGFTLLLTAYTSEVKTFKDRNLIRAVASRSSQQSTGRFYFSVLCLIRPITGQSSSTFLIIRSNREGQIWFLDETW